MKDIIILTDSRERAELAEYFASHGISTKAGKLTFNLGFSLSLKVFGKNPDDIILSALEYGKETNKKLTARMVIDDTIQPVDIDEITIYKIMEENGEDELRLSYLPLKKGVTSACES